jgi:hypothetical protein
MSRLFIPLVLFALYFLSVVYGTEIGHELDTLKASNPANSDRFSTGLDFDGSTALIASPFTATGGKSNHFEYWCRDEMFYPKFFRGCLRISIQQWQLDSNFNHHRF